MTAQDHIIAWIESDRRSYDRLLEITRKRQPDCTDRYTGTAPCLAALLLVTSAYREMVRTGDAAQDDPYSAVDMLKAAILICEWELV